MEAAEVFADTHLIKESKSKLLKLKTGVLFGFDPDKQVLLVSVLLPDVQSKVQSHKNNNGVSEGL